MGRREVVEVLSGIAPEDVTTSEEAMAVIEAMATLRTGMEQRLWRLRVQEQRLRMEVVVAPAAAPRQLNQQDWCDEGF